ncbi:MAG: glycoside hydrolase family 9 protein [Oscillospiraceae bacterium]|nr:glycoside hydrolase family 9 protein [Oscillospiraceae bacterium]
MSKKILVNQLGYCRNMCKTAAFIGIADDFRVVDALTGKTVFQSLASEPVSDKASADMISVLDFSALDRCGSYYIRTGIRRSPVFSISENPYGELKKALLKGLYYNRCAPLDRRYAGEYAHGSCHTELVPLFDSSAKRLDVSGGWHDSGGYGKFVVCTCVTLGHLLYAYKLFPESFEDSSDIPESGNGIPDILNECRVGLEWLLKMQARDGGVYHKVSSIKSVPIIMPEDDMTEKFVFPKSHQASTCFCAVTSLASRIFRPFDEDFSNRLNEASLNAWIWLMNNPHYVPFENPPTIAVTAAGDFYDDEPDDEMFWAVCELYETTGDKSFHDRILGLYGHVSVTGFVNRENGGFGALAYLFGDRPKNEFAEQAMRLQLRVRADNLYSLSCRSGYRTAKSEDDYIRGSNMYSMTDSIALILAYKIFGCEEYLRTVCEQLNYILGKNPMDICYVTGFGSRSVMHPHHRISEMADVNEPVPGLLVCGPNNDANDSFTQWNIPADTPPAKSYYDILYSFSTNESAIYCNSAAVFVTGYLESVNKIG